MNARASARLSAASALRRLNHALVAHHADDHTLDRICTFVDDILPALTKGERRDRATLLSEHAHAIFGGAPDDVPGAVLDDPFNVMADRAVGGRANPTATEIDVRYEHDDAVAVVTLGPAFEGATGRAHGGMVAAIFDDVTGYVLRLAGTPAFTARLTVSYHAPTPLEVPLEFRSRLEAREPRKLHITAECHHDGQRIASAQALYVTVDPERFRQQ